MKQKYIEEHLFRFKHKKIVSGSALLDKSLRCFIPETISSAKIQTYFQTDKCHTLVSEQLPDTIADSVRDRAQNHNRDRTTTPKTNQRIFPRVGNHYSRGRGTTDSMEIHKNKTMKTNIRHIPTGTDKESTHMRRTIIMEQLWKLIGKTPAASQRQKKMNMKTIYELSARLPHIGEVKIIVGERASKRILHYCITKKRP